MGKQPTGLAVPAVINPLRLSPAEYRQLLRTVNQSATDRDSGSRRSGGRVNYSADSRGVVVKIRQMADAEDIFLVHPRNLSSTGLSFFYPYFLHQHTRCLFLLRTLKKEPLGVVGHVVRCRHVTGNIHEVGVKFQSSVDMSQLSDEVPVEKVGPRIPPVNAPADSGGGPS